MCVLNSPLIWTRCRFLKCFTVISRMSAFSNLECLELCGTKCAQREVIFARFKTDNAPMQTYVFFKRVQDERLELPQAFVYSRSSPFFHDRFR